MLPCAFRIKFTYYWGEWLWALQKAIDSTSTSKDYAKKQVSLILTSLNKQLCNESQQPTSAWNVAARTFSSIIHYKATVSWSLRQILRRFDFLPEWRAHIWRPIKFSEASRDDIRELVYRDTFLGGKVWHTTTIMEVEKATTMLSSRALWRLAWPHKKKCLLPPLNHRRFTVGFICSLVVGVPWDD